MTMSPAAFSQSDKRGRSSVEDKVDRMITMMQVFDERQQLFSQKLNQVYADSEKIISFLNDWNPGIFDSISEHKGDHQNVPTKADINMPRLSQKFERILDGLTLRNVHVIVNQVKQLSINNPDHLNEFVDLIVKKAIDVPDLCETYARMCKSLSTAQFVQIDSTVYPDKNQTSFWRALLKNCQMRFEFREKIEAEHVQYKEQINNEMEECFDPEKLKELQSQLEEDEEDFQMKAWGLFRFIGELFKLDMLNASIMHYYITNLLEKNEEEPLNTLCRLLTLIGEHYESKVETRAQALNSIMNKLAQRAKDSRHISSRTKSMIQDLLDLWRNEWVPSQDDGREVIFGKIQEINDLLLRNLEGSNSQKQKKNEGSDVMTSSHSSDNKKAKKDNKTEEKRDKDKGSTKEEGEEKELYNKVKTILKKLTPQNSYSIASQITDLPINNPDQLAEVIYSIIDEAISRYDPSEAFAKMCRILSLKEIMNFEKVSRDINLSDFREMLSHCCQKRFELTEKMEAEFKEKVAKEQKECTEPEKLRRLKLRHEDEKRKSRKKAEDLCRFLGELFNYDLLKTSTMHHCITHLLKRTENEPLENLCKLLISIGKFYEIRVESSTQELDPIMDELSKLVKMKNEKDGNAPQISSRITYMIQDVLDVRANNWQLPNHLKKYSKSSKTVDRSDKEVDQEKFKSNLTPKMGERTRSRFNSRDFETEDWRGSKHSLKTSHKSGYNSSNTSIASSGQLELQSGGSSATDLKSNKFHDLKLKILKTLKAHRPDDALIPVQDCIKENWEGSKNDHTLIRSLMTAICEASIVGSYRYRNTQLNQIVFQKYFKIIKHFVNNDPNLEAHCLMAVCWLMDFLRYPRGLALNFFQNLKEQGMSIEGFKRFHCGNKLTPKESSKDRWIRQNVVRETRSFWESIHKNSDNLNDDNDDDDNNGSSDRNDYFYDADEVQSSDSEDRSIFVRFHR